jgi:adenylate cyclase
MRLPPRFWQEARFVVVVLAAGFFVGTAEAVIESGSFATGLLFRSGINGFFIAFACIAADILFIRRISRRPFLIVLIVRTAVFALAGAVVVGSSRAVFTGEPRFLLDHPRNILSAVGVTLVVSFFASVLISARRALGKQAFVWLFTGRYCRPVEETRMFLFVDLASSTAVAEKIGHVRFHDFIHSFWCDITDAILAAKGEIYKYVGDQAIVTWAIREGKTSDAWLRCFFDMQDSIERKRGDYLRKFGTFPLFRGSLHCGKVIAGEIGDCKREVAFLGDTVNTAERILEAGKKFNREFLISGEAMKRTSGMEQYRTEAVPAAVLKGKSEQIELFAVARDKNPV